MTVLVDADACPVKRIIVEEARRREARGLLRVTNLAGWI